MTRVLVVDDNVQLAENLAEIIFEAGLGEGVIADSGVRALELLEREPFDVLLTDMRMPGMNGAELIRRARRANPDLPVMLMSAFAGSDDMSEAMREGLLTVFGKPLPMKPFLELLARARRVRPILIVEDNVALADNLADLLRQRGLSTVTAHTLSEIERISGGPSVAIVDLRLPGGPDCMSLERVRTRFPDASIVAMTAFRSEIGSLPACPILDKPFKMDSAIELVEELCSPPHSAADVS